MVQWTPVMRAQEASASILVLHTIGTSTFAYIGLILIRALLVLRRSGERPPGFLSVAVMIVLASLLKATWLAGVWLSLSPPTWLDLLALAVTFLCLLTVPVVMSLQYLFVAPFSKESSAARKWVSRFMAINCIGGVIAMMFAFALKTRAIILLLPPIVCVLAALLLGTGGIPLFRQPGMRRRGLLLFATFTGSGLTVVAAVLTYANVVHIRVRGSFGCNVLLEASLLSIVVGMVFVFANLRLADLIVKRVMRVAAVAYFAEAMCVLVTIPSRWQHPADSTPAEAAFYLLIVLAGALGSRVAPVAVRALDGWIDRWLFEQPDFESAIESLWGNLLGQESPEDVFRMAEQTIRETLSLAAVRIVSIRGLKEGTEIGLVTGPGPYFVQPGSSLHGTMSPAPDVILPLFVQDVAEQWIVLTRGLLRPPLTAMELRFVERVAGQVHIRVAILLAEQRRLNDLRREQAFRQELSDAEMRALRAQINPHFLFNSLNTIADLTATAPDRAEEMTLRLSAVFRYLLTHTDRPLTSVKEELAFARSYLYIEEARFEDRLKVIFDVDSGVLDVKVPTLLLQPLIENALKHGISQKREGGTLTISVKRSADAVILAVSDDGRGLQRSGDTASPEGTRVGLTNVRCRLYAAYGEAARFTLRSRLGGGAEAMVEIQKGHLQSV